MTSKQKKWFKSVFSSDNISSPDEPAQKRHRSESDSSPSLNLNHSQNVNNSKITENVPLQKIKYTNFKSSNWIENFSPQSIDDLSIHPKKIEELDDWFKFTVKNSSKCASTMLLITGPSGAGKTIAVKLLANKYGYEINEWVTPIDVDLERYNKSNDEANTYMENQTDKFSQFLFRSSRYASVFAGLSKRLVLVEDFPNVFLKDADGFNEILTHYSEYGKSPLLFIVTDTKSKKLNIAFNLFENSIREQHKISHISFNAISSTLLKKGLKRICTIMKQTGFSAYYKQPSQDLIDSIVLTSQGDIRNAVINLHFASQKNSSNLPTQVFNNSSKPTKGKSSNKKLKSVGCDQNITMMHAIGRVLNPKYVENASNKYQKFVHSPEQLTDEFLIQPTTFINLIHTNYLCHYENIEDVFCAADVLSSTDVLMNEWRDESLTRVALNLAIRGIMVCNKKPVSGWLPIKGKKKKQDCINLQEEIKNIGTSYATSGRVIASDYRTYAKIILSNYTKSRC